MIQKKVKRLLMMTLIILVIIFTNITKDLKITKKKKINNELEIEKFNKNIKFSKSKENKTEPYLEFNGQIQELSPLVSSDGRTVTTKYLENSLINKPTTDENGKITLILANK